MVCSSSGAVDLTPSLQTWESSTPGNSSRVRSYWLLHVYTEAVTLVHSGPLSLFVANNCFIVMLACAKRSMCLFSCRYTNCGGKLPDCQLWGWCKLLHYPWINAFDFPHFPFYLPCSPKDICCVTSSYLHVPHISLFMFFSFIFFLLPCADECVSLWFRLSGGMYPWWHMAVGRLWFCRQPQAEESQKEIQLQTSPFCWLQD